MDPFPGAEIGGYRLDRKVGEGAFGAVWRGIHKESGERAALKLLLPAAAASPEQVSRFHREADLLARLRSHNVARMIDFVVDPIFGVVLVMELIEGELLSDMLAAENLSVPDTIDLGIQLLAGARDLHAQGILHRDLKPNNIMLCGWDVERPRRAVIFDLGLSRLVRNAKQKKPAGLYLTPSFVVLGTVACIAPEQILNAREVTERADLYAVGTILYRALVGHYPFVSDDERTLAAEKLTLEAPSYPVDPTDAVAVGLRDVIARAIRRQPAERYASAEEMMTALESLEVEEARRSRPAPPQGTTPSARPGAASRVAIGVGVATLVASVVAWWASHH